MAWRPRSSNEQRAFREGVRDLMPAAPATFAWGLVTGVAMVKSGLTLAQAVGMSLTVFAGSAQLSSLPLIAGAAPVWVIVLTALVVNLRFVIYAAALKREFQQFSLPRRWVLGYLTGDIGFVIFMNKLQREGRFAHADWYFLGGAVCNWCAWQLASMIGIFAAAVVPTHWGLELAGTLALLALLIPLANTRPGVVGVLVASIVAVIAYPLPLRLGLVMAVVCGIVAAMMVEPREPRATMPAEGGRAR
ncbi:MAG TPA: AzlC family ABC transporter permease [Burkholderiaceae bacterium]|nr:AzlC family ABC transporter permease [Burkholderiaceae bacterium]